MWDMRIGLFFVCEVGGEVMYVEVIDDVIGDIVVVFN